MKRIKKKNLGIFLIINLFIAGVISFLVTSVTSERNITKLMFEQNVANKYIDFLKTKGVFTSYEDPPDFIRRLDDKIRTENEIYDLKNDCININKLKGTLPVSFISKENFIDIEITSNSRESVKKCSLFIVQQIKLYNERVRERYKENFTYFETLEEKEEEIKIIEQINDTLYKVFELLDKTIITELDESGKTSQSTDEEINLKVINTYLGLNSYIEGKLKDKRQSATNFLNINKEKFFSVVDSLTPIVFRGEFSYIQSPPKFYQIFLATYVIGIFLYFLSITISNKTFIKRLTK